MKKPKFLIQTINSDGTKEDPKLYKVQELPDEKVEDWSMSRRGFLMGASVAIGAYALLGKPGYGECCNNIPAHTGFTRSVNFSPDGKLLASNSDDHTVKLWEIPSGKLLKTLEVNTRKNNTNCFWTASFTPEGQYLELRDNISNHTIELWEMPSGKLFKTLEYTAGYVDFINFSPDGKYLAASLSDTKTGDFKIWEIPSGKLVITLSYIGHVVCFSPDGNYFAAGSSDETIRLWEIPSGKLFKTLFSHASHASSIEFSPDGNYLVSTSGSGTFERGEIAKLWEIPSGKLLSTFTDLTYSADSVKFNPESKLLATSHYDNVKLWEIPSGKLLKTIKGNPNEVKSVKFSFDGKYLASVSSTSIKIWQMPKVKLTTTLEGDKISFSPDGKFIASANFPSYTIKIWEMPTGKLYTCLFDPSALNQGEEVISYTIETAKGQSRIYAVPYTTVIPKAAVCTCNSVKGSYCSCVGYHSSGGGGGGSYQICTCIPIK